MGLTLVDLFCGCGGMSWGLAKSGFEVLAGVDNWGPALETFVKNHPQSLAVASDLRDLSPKELMEQIGLPCGRLDCLVGGPPCQGFSKNVPASYRFLEDERNLLFRTFLDFVAYLEPKTVVMENVAEMRNAYGGWVTEEIIDCLSRLGYAVSVDVIHMRDFGIPQRRRRCFFFASRTDVHPVFPRPSHAERETTTLFGKMRQYNSAWSAISDLPSRGNGEGTEPDQYATPPQNRYQKTMRAESDAVYDHLARKLTEKQFRRLSSLNPGQGMNDLADDLRPRSGYSGAYGRLDYDMLAPTITRWVFHPGSGRFGHPRDDRVITIREAARLQGFTDDFRFTGTYTQKAHQVGNAVPPLFMTMMGEAIRECCEVPSAEAERSCSMTGVRDSH